eukprot:CAMPEP_0195085508 /NCGR_PEP_ID=MMETSP0448-20130528/25901_1 /TAXON_ID=66468 /ORGANISM="Heterocapsa triquestra, Strain CCMP 448" /LENGTH=46 /DNA_ID= /DNA_START= /DNA_END= /DNA_ORIENTATION=
MMLLAVGVQLTIMATSHTARGVLVNTRLSPKMHAAIIMGWPRLFMK